MTRRLPILLALLLAPAAARAEDAAPAVNGADTAFVLFSAALVLLMTPGLAFFYGGLTRGKNVVHTMLLSFACIAFVGITWALVGYSLAFAPSGTGGAIGGLSFVGLANVGTGVNADLAGTIPHLSFALFQGMFAVITPALISGAVVERIKTKAFLLFAILFSLLVYAPVCHWVWAPGGWLRELGALDFAGGTVVHITAATAAVVAAFVVGPRKGLKVPTTLPHNVPFTLLGAGLLAFGWMGFNGGSALAAGELAATAFAATFFGAAAASASWSLLELFLHGRISAVGMASGAVAGLVAVTPAAGFVTPMGSLLLGGLAGAACLLAVRARPKLKIDDSLDVFAIHGVAGILGALLTGVLASPAANPAVAAGSLKQLGIQTIGVLATVAFTAVVSFVLLKLVALVTPLRADAADESGGLDLAEAGERAYTESDKAGAFELSGVELAES